MSGRGWLKRNMLKERKKALEAAFRSNDGYELVSASAYFSYVRHPSAPE